MTRTAIRHEGIGIRARRESKRRCVIPSEQLCRIARKDPFAWMALRRRCERMRWMVQNVRGVVVSHAAFGITAHDRWDSPLLCGDPSTHSAQLLDAAARCSCSVDGDGLPATPGTCEGASVRACDTYGRRGEGRMIGFWRLRSLLQSNTVKCKAFIHACVPAAAQTAVPTTALTAALTKSGRRLRER
jgi:hypothetical protein